MKRKRLVFTLAELIVTVVIVGILASVAIVGYRKAIESSRGRDACIQLKLIQTAEKMRYLEQNSYVSCSNTSDCSQKLGLDLVGQDWKYSVVVNSGFTAKAERVGVVSGQYNENCSYSITQDDEEPTGTSCVYTP
ncbi:MAG: prepilin-type N-terminal cleavage/methylation domain-containing protein [Candidatus Omnitrophica bacterium]|nr:prepilin-type N-terminal cleavage/methylation domain-containing protein [Candidatus Omnitrophota bacterium]